MYDACCFHGSQLNRKEDNETQNKQNRTQIDLYTFWCLLKFSSITNLNLYIFLSISRSSKLQRPIKTKTSRKRWFPTKINSHHLQLVAFYATPKPYFCWPRKLLYLQDTIIYIEIRNPTKHIYTMTKGSCHFLLLCFKRDIYLSTFFWLYLFTVFRIAMGSTPVQRCYNSDDPCRGNQTPPLSPLVCYQNSP